ncbi:MAG: BamA/TamA family outer membrane protein, partial [Candidatus Zixiibacteriota bacterium]
VYRKALTALAGICLTLCISSAAAEKPDTTAVRDPKPPPKSVSEILLFVPSKILQLPFYVLREITRPVVQVAARPGGDSNFFGDVFSSKRTVAPIVSAGSRSGIVGGLSLNFHNSFTPEDRLRFVLTHSTHDYQRYKIGYRTPHLFSSSKTSLWMRLVYQNRTRERFFGTGLFRPLSDEISYRMEKTEFTVDVKSELSSGFSITFLGGYLKSQVFDGENPNVESRVAVFKSLLSFSDEDVRPSKVWSIGAALRHDSRDNLGQPSRGGEELIEAVYHRAPDSSGDVEYVSTRVDLRRYLTVYDRRILALRVAAESIDRPGDARPVPFYLLNRLGGQDDLRGFKTDRFADSDLALASVEYRYPVWDVVDAFLLLDAGRVFRDIEDDLTLRDWEVAYGFGFRIWKPEGLTASLSFARSDEETRYYFLFEEGI